MKENEIDELQEVKNELRRIADEFLLAIDSSENAIDVATLIGDHFNKLNHFANITFVTEAPKKSNIIIP
jgi:hypothetical protein